MKRIEKIIPAILVKSIEEFEERIRAVEPLVEIVQIDAMDNKFVPNWTFFNPQELEGLHTRLDYEVHLMVEKEMLQIAQWKKLGAKRLIVHYGACKKDLVKVIKEIKEAGMECGVALNPDEDADLLKPVIKEIDLVLIMTVKPGFGGQKFMKDPLKKVSMIKKWNANVLVEVDGGIGSSNIEECLEAGVDLFAVNSSIFGQPDLAKALKELNQLIKV